ncbi:hypothetical protein CUJ84_Chr001634 [Rhizobium leguminosarum]|uniref:Uncharacterized protein n=1 Tax=Rhizobium leguminosarum TaxID=384 RepID=A0A2K9Z1C7_RHILE|nr:hypothetical protein CUJ84_Chr001634 [Rhizobium leguminosarum]
MPETGCALPLRRFRHQVSSRAWSILMISHRRYGTSRSTKESPFQPFPVRFSAGSLWGKAFLKPVAKLMAHELILTVNEKPGH